MSSVTISAADVNKLRQQTGAGMMDCRAALQETNGDFEAAIDYLRKKGQKVAAKRSDRDAKEGVVIAKTSADHSYGIVLNLTSETDFVAKNEDFINLALSFADTAVANNCTSLEAFKACAYENITIEDKLMETVAKIGEKIDVTSFERIEAASVVAYNHAGYRVAVLVGLNQAHNEANETAGRDAAMQGSEAQMWVQTRHPDHPLFASLARHDYAGFAAQQLKERAQALLPPFSSQALLRAEARSQAVAQAFLQAAQEAAAALAGELITVYPPVPMSMQRVADVERAQMLLESSSRAALQKFLEQWLPHLRGLRSLPQCKGLIRFAVDVDPQAI